ncbi:MAG: class C sortase [Firmicutes bacterium]|nr:class C sortase [Bacillota bacterium]
MSNGEKQKKKRKRKLRFSTVLILLMLMAGLGVMLYPTSNDWYYRWKASRDIAQYNTVTEGSDVDYSEMWEAAEEYNRLLAENGNFTVYADSDMVDEISRYLNPLGTGMMGYIDIPAINVHIPIYQGTDEAALQAGAGFWLGTSLPTGGESTHCVLTAHSGLVKAKMFTDIDQLEIGDTFTITVLDRTLTYEVDQILVVEPDDFSALAIIDGEDHVTLYTCTPYGINTHRLLVRGTRTENAATSSATDDIAVISEFVIVISREDIILIVVVLLIVLLLLVLQIVILVFLLFASFKKKRREKAKFRKAKEGRHDV